MEALRIISQSWPLAWAFCSLVLMVGVGSIVHRALRRGEKSDERELEARVISREVAIARGSD